MKNMLVFAFIAAAAATAVAAPSLDAGRLGHMKGIVDVCSRVNARDASRYFLQMKEMIGDAPRDALAQLTKSDEYQQAYQSVTSELKSMEPDEMGRACSVYLGAAD